MCEALANVGLTFTRWLHPILSITRCADGGERSHQGAHALGEAGRAETDVLSIETASQPGVGKIAERLAEAEVNIEYTYLAAGREAEKGLIILRPSDVEKARRYEL